MDNNYVTITSTYTPCKKTGFYQEVKFLFFKRKFLACEICGRKHNDSGWILFFMEYKNNE
jgi:hypothetical protein